MGSGSRRRVSSLLSALLAAGSMAGLAGAAPQPAGAATAVGAVMTASGQPTVFAGRASQPAGDLTITVPHSTTPTFDTAPMPPGVDVLLTVQDAAAANCASREETVGFAGLPTVTEIAAAGGASIPLAPRPNSSAACSRSKTRDGVAFTVAATTRFITITGIFYDVGPGTPRGAIVVNATASCATCDVVVTCGGGAGCPNATVGTGPVLQLQPTPASVVTDSSVTLNVTVANQGDATSLPTTVTFSSDGWDTLQTDVPEIPAGGNAIVSAMPLIPDRARGSTVMFVVALPGDGIPISLLVDIPAFVPVTTTTVGSGSTTGQTTATGATTTTGPTPTTTSTPNHRHRRAIPIAHWISSHGPGSGAVLVLLLALAGFAFAFALRGRRLLQRPRLPGPIAYWGRRRNAFAAKPSIVLSIGIDPARRTITWKKARP